MHLIYTKDCAVYTKVLSILKMIEVIMDFA